MRQETNLGAHRYNSPDVHESLRSSHHRSHPAFGSDAPGPRLRQEPSRAWALDAGGGEIAVCSLVSSGRNLRDAGRDAAPGPAGVYSCRRGPGRTGRATGCASWPRRRAPARSRGAGDVALVLTAVPGPREDVQAPRRAWRWRRFEGIRSRRRAGAAPLVSAQIVVSEDRPPTSRCAVATCSASVESRASAATERPTRFLRGTGRPGGRRCGRDSLAWTSSRRIASAIRRASSSVSAREAPSRRG